MPNIGKFRASLANFGVDEEVCRRINEGYEDLRDNSPKPPRAEYFRRATEILDEELDEETMRLLYSSNACCRSGARQKASKEFAKENEGLSLSEKLMKIPQVRYMGEPKLNPDGSITSCVIAFEVDGKFHCACPNFNKVKRDYPVSRSYCYCCAGHFKYHYELMLGVGLRIAEVISSPLDSGGDNPCVMRFELEKEDEK